MADYLKMKYYIAKVNCALFFRGIDHLLCCFTIFPYFIWKYYNFGINKFSIYVGFFNLLCIYAVHIISAILHTFDMYSIKYEIIIQKMDIIGIGFYIGTSYFPIMLLFPTYISIPFTIIVTAQIIRNSINVWNSNYSLADPAVLISFQIPIFYYIYNLFTSIEWICNLVAISSLGIAAIFLFSKYTPPFLNPNIFGYFELYHLASISCLVSTLIMNYSIVTRIAKH